MSDGSVPGRGFEAARQHRYLPVLAVLLLVVIAVWFVNYLVLLRPSGEHRQRVSAFSNALRIIRRHYVREVPEEELYEAAMDGMIKSLDDRYSTYMTAAQLQQANIETTGEFGGVGIRVAYQEGKIIITEIIGGGPADQTGIEAGDVIVKVDGEESARYSFLEVIAMIRGEVGSHVRLTVARGSPQELLDFEILREKISLETVKAEFIEPGLGYVRIDRFDEQVRTELGRELEGLKQEGLNGLILDLRYNMGGLLGQAVSVCDLFISEGSIAGLESRLSTETDEFRANPHTAIPLDVPMVVLVDARTASAAEIVAGALKYLGRATVIGTRTFGKGAVSRIYPLGDGSGMALTVAYYKVASDKVIERNGVEPDIVVGELPPFPTDGDKEQAKEWLALYESAREQQLSRAIEFLKEKTGRVPAQD